MRHVPARLVRLAALGGRTACCRLFHRLCQRIFVRDKAALCQRDSRGHRGALCLCRCRKAAKTSRKACCHQHCRPPQKPDLHHWNSPPFPHLGRISLFFGLSACIIAQCRTGSHPAQFGNRSEYLPLSSQLHVIISVICSWRARLLSCFLCTVLVSGKPAVFAENPTADFCRFRRDVIYISGVGKDRQADRKRADFRVFSVHGDRLQLPAQK